MHIRMLVALAYVPNNDKVRVYEELIELDSFPEVDQLLNYFEDTFIGRRQRRADALFSSDIATKLCVMILLELTTQWKDGTVHLHGQYKLLTQLCRG